MTNEQILKKAIEKAVDNGYKYSDMDKYPWFQYIQEAPCIIIFSHDFAKAFFGEKHKDVIIRNMALADGIDEEKHPVIYTSKNLDWWQYQLQQLVLEKEPLKILEKFL